jgi:hypothetical protein
VRGPSPGWESWKKLIANSHAQIGYTPNPQASICAGAGCGSENYMTLAKDAAAARFSDGGLTAATNYAYDVSALNKRGESADSAVAMVTTGP